MTGRLEVRVARLGAAVLALASAVGLAAVVGGVAAAGAATTTTVHRGVSTGPGGITLQASLDGHAVRGSNDRTPVRLRPVPTALLAFRVHNPGRTAVEVGTVRLEGRVLGLTLMAFDTQVDVRVPARSTAFREFQVDLTAAKNQATGLIPGSVRLLDARHRLIVAEPLVADVRGSGTSVYSVFGLLVAAVTAISFLGALIALARGRLSPNRWWRATRFLTVGFGLGLVLVYSLSATRVWAPRPARSGVLILISAAALFLLGYLTPTPAGAERGALDDDDVDDDAAAAMSVPTFTAEVVVEPEPQPQPEPVPSPAPSSWPAASPTLPPPSGPPTEPPAGAGLT